MRSAFIGSLMRYTLQRAADQVLGTASARAGQHPRGLGRFVTKPEQRAPGLGLRAGRTRRCFDSSKTLSAIESVAHLDNQPLGGFATHSRNPRQRRYIALAHATAKNVDCNAR